MNQKLEIIEHYFKLSDLASSDRQALITITNLFSNNAVVEGANGVIADNPTKIISLFEHFSKIIRNFAIYVVSILIAMNTRLNGLLQVARTTVNCLHFMVLINTNLINKIK
ncbi:hypothetical protein [Oenococcus oeni]|uniref:hypothetical protein n=1 Tax=Oenococcus oeni TaxID=1247 RepID=UPI000AC8F0CF|nr:hypothetical protein [Oenococcus oeni]